MELRHELPTHLAVEDRILAGLTVRQLMLVLAGLPCTYAGWVHSQGLPPALRVALAAAGVAFTLATTLLRPGRRDLSTWALVLLRYVALPKRCVWRHPATVAAPADQAERWQPLHPVVAWDTTPVAEEGWR